MHELIEARRADIEALCRRLGVRRLDVFAVRNPYFLDEVMRNRECLYAG